MIEVRHRIPRHEVVLGLIRAENVSPDAPAVALEERLAALLTARRNGPGPMDEPRRAAVRDMLRNGRYKPTGRGKPASEYLLRAAEDGRETSFPRINAPVDVCNYVSLKYLVPISLWDLDLAGTDRFIFRLGRPGESYVFNQGGQVIDVEDLVVGCRVTAGLGDEGAPIVNPVKDSLATKTTPETRRVAACIYVPLAAFSEAEARSVCEEMAGLMAAPDGVDVAVGLARPDETIVL